LKDAESLWVETNIGGRQYVIGVIYRHPKYDCKCFTDDISAMLHYLSDKKLYTLFVEILTKIFYNTQAHQVYINIFKIMKVIIVNK